MWELMDYTTFPIDLWASVIKDLLSIFMLFDFEIL